MKTFILACCCFMLMAAPAAADEIAAAGGAYQVGVPFDGDVRTGYRWVTQEGSRTSGEYEDLHSGIAGSAIIEYDPLPNRLLFEVHALSDKDYFGELDYSYGDIFVLNALGRSLFHNLNHYSLGEDDPTTSSPVFQDYDPLAVYGLQDAMNRAQVRIKAPDFPFHIYLEAKNQRKDGLAQQLFLSAFSGSGGFSKSSRSRDIDWRTREVRGTVNSHLGPVEVEYSHTAKQFEATAETRVMTDIFSGTNSESNLVPSLESSSDTIKIHSSHTGRIAAAGTYSQGEKLNNDSGTKVVFVNAAGDVTLIPWKELTISVKYRHFDVDEQTPDLVTFSGSAGTLSVRNGIDSQRDLVSGLVRFRATENLTVRMEYAWESLFRTVWPGYSTLPSGEPAYWTLDQRIAKSTARLGATYRLTNRLYLRGDMSRQTAEAPPTSLDNTYPETSDNARGTLTWSPTGWLSLLLAGGVTQEERDQLGAPLAGAKTADRSYALGSATFVIGKKTSITPGYAYFQNSMTSAIAYQDSTGAITAETGVPYADTAHVGTLTVAHAVSDTVSLSADVGRAYLRGNYRSAGVVPGSAGIQNLSDLKSVETTAVADLQIQYTQFLGSQLRYQFRKIDDILDHAQDGKTQLVFAALTFKW